MAHTGAFFRAEIHIAGGEVKITLHRFLNHVWVGAVTKITTLVAPCGIDISEGHHVQLGDDHRRNVDAGRRDDTQPVAVGTFIQADETPDDVKPTNNQACLW